jgi:hypothetical protein
MTNAEILKLLGPSKRTQIRAIWVVTVFQDGSTSVVKQQ